MKKLFMLGFLVFLVGCNPVAPVTVNIQDLEKVSTIKGFQYLRLTYFPSFTATAKVNMAAEFNNSCGELTINVEGDTIKEATDKLTKRVKCFEDSCKAK